jgi:hypothetical protein
MIMKHFFLAILILPFACLAQKSDTIKYRPYDNTFGITPNKPPPTFLHSSFQRFVIVGDSVYNTLSNIEFNSKLDKGKYYVHIETNPDSIQRILMSRVKAIVILKDQSDPNKKRK